MSWPVGKVEQLLKIQALQRQLEEVQSGRRSVVIHAYYPPSRADWELAYQRQRSGSLPIPPGTKLCWYDMRSGWMRTYTTAWDRENGTASSGEIYNYSQNQNSSYFRFLGNIDVAGYLRGGENNTPSVHFGLDIGNRIRQRLLMLEIFFSLDFPTAAVTNYIYINYGSLVVQVDISGVRYRQIEGGLSSGAAAASNSSSSTQPYRVTSLPARSGANPTWLAIGKLCILNPFGGRTEDSRPDGFAQTSVFGYIFAPDNSYRQFLAISMINLNFDQYYRIFHTTDNTGADDNLARKGRGWVYGYFDEQISSLEEYE